MYANSRAIVRTLLRHKVLTSIFATLLFAIFIVPINQAVLFAPEVPEIGSRLVPHILRLIFGVFLFSTLYFGLHFIDMIRKGDTFYRSWLRYSLIYSAIIGAFFLLLYPGHWVMDEFYVLNDLQNYHLGSWQHIFTPVYYALALLLVPTAPAIVALQAVFISLTVGYVIAKFARIFTVSSRSRRVIILVLLFLPFLLGPTILHNLYPMRLTIYAYLLLLLVVKLFFLFAQKEKPRDSYSGFALYTLLITLLAFWRTEGIYFLLLLPLIAYRLRIFSRPSAIPPRGVAWIAVSVVLFLAGTAANFVTANPRHQVLATLNPISVMLPKIIENGESKDNLNKISTVVDPQVLSKHFSSYVDIPAYWQYYNNADSPVQAFKNGYEKYISTYNRGALGLIIEHPILFIEARVKTFLATMGLDSQYSKAWVGELLDKDIANDSVDSLIDSFTAQNKASTPLSHEVKDTTTRALALIGTDNTITPARQLVWNIIPIFLLVTVVIGACLIRKRWVYAFLVSLVLLHPLIVFITAPAHLFMYYFPFYLNGAFILSVALCFLLRKSRLPR